MNAKAWFYSQSFVSSAMRESPVEQLRNDSAELQKLATQTITLPPQRAPDEQEALEWMLACADYPK